MPKGTKSSAGSHNLRLCRTSGGGERLGAVLRGGQLSPGLAEPDRFPRARQQLFLGIIMLPTAALVELKKMRATLLGERTPFLGDLHRHAARQLRGPCPAPPRR